MKLSGLNITFALFGATILATVSVTVQAQAFPFSSDLIALYKFDDQNNMGKDSSGHNNDATNLGAGYTATGFSGGAASFNGTTDYLRAAINLDPSVTPQLTWGAWVKPDTTVTIDAGRAVLSVDNGGFDREIGFDDRSGGNWMGFNGAGAFSSGVAPSLSNWTFLASVYNQSNSSMTLYVNGQSFTKSTSFGASQSFLDIGANPISEPTQIRFWSGLIDNAFVYNTALTPTQIGILQANGFATPEPGVNALLAAMTMATSGVLIRRRRK